MVRAWLWICAQTGVADSSIHLLAVSSALVEPHVGHLVWSGANSRPRHEHARQVHDGFFVGDLELLNVRDLLRGVCGNRPGRG